MNRLRRAVALFGWSVHYDGFLFTVLRILFRMTRLYPGLLDNSAWFQRFALSRFDRRYNVSTSGVVERDKLDIEPGLLGSAVQYMPTFSPEFGYILSELKLDYDDFTFVELGSGKGRAVLMASDFPFKKIMGVELSPSLHEVAVNNTRSYKNRSQKCFDIVNLNGNAAEFTFPDGNLVIYLFNPFSDAVLDRVIDNLACSLTASPRKTYIVYLNPQYRHSIDRCTLFNGVAALSNERFAIYEFTCAENTR